MMFLITSLTSLSLLPELADVAVDALVVSDDVEAVDPVKVFSKDCTEDKAELTVEMEDSIDVTSVDRVVF